MNSKLNLIVCETYLKEVEYVKEVEGYDDIDILSYPADCMNCMPDEEASCHCVHKDEHAGQSNTLYLFRCRPKKIGVGSSHSAINNSSMCFSVVAGETIVNSLIQQGAYILTPGWLAKWRSYVIDTWGFEESNARLFFAEFSNKLILLDTGVYESAKVQFEEFSEYVGLHSTVISVGVDYMAKLISQIYWKWKNDCKERAIQTKNKQLAQYSFVYEMLFEINKLVKPEEIIEKMFELFVMLTGSTKIAYLSTQNGNIDDIQTYRNKAYEGDLLKLELNFVDYQINNRRTGYLLKAELGDGATAYLEIDEVAVKENIPEYLRLSMYVFRICTYMISNRNEIYKMLKSIMQLEEENKTKSTFFANISHELRTPINVVFSGIQLVEKLIESNSKEKLVRAEFHLSSMKQNCFRLLRLVNNVIDITKIESKFMSMNLKNVNIIHIIQGVTSSVEEYAKQKSISVAFKTNNLEIIMAVDVEKIDRIFFNLLSNAVKFTPVNGSIVVSVEQRVDCVAISVKDNGIGIPDTMLSAIFNRFTQVENSLVKTHEGSGIGLSMVKSLVDMHKGKITVQSSEGKGSEFVVELPLGATGEAISVLQDYEERQQHLVEMLNIEFSDIYIDR